MARTKSSFNPPPNVKYKALYPWASTELLDETSTLDSSEDVRKHREGEPDYKGRVFGRESDTHVSVRPCAKGEPVCADDRANDGAPFFFLYSTIFKRIKLRLPLTSFRGCCSRRSTWPPPSCIPTVGPSWGRSLYCATTLGTLLPSTSSFISLKLWAPWRTFGEL